MREHCAPYEPAQGRGEKIGREPVSPSVETGVAAQRPVPALTQRAKAFGYEARQLWIDASANWNWLVDPAKIADIVAKAKDSGFTELIFDVKPIVGNPLFPSELIPQLSLWKGISKPPDLDILGTVLQQAHARGLKCLVSVNTFSEGHGLFERAGPIWDHPEWASTAVVWNWLATRGAVSLDCGSANPTTKPTKVGIFTPGGKGLLQKYGTPSDQLALDATGNPTEGEWTYLLASWNGPIPLSGAGSVLFVPRASLEKVTTHPNEYTALFVSPLQSEARQLQIDMLKEIAARYPVDGIVFDRMRFEGLTNDFGPLMQAAFTRRFGEPGRWPESILKPPAKPGDEPGRGARYAEFQLLRASVIRDFFLEARTQLRDSGFNQPIGVYVGAWYDIYEDVGVNWADDTLATQYPWAGAEYRFAGYADALDFLCVGSYYPVAEPEERPDAPLLTVGGACDRAVEVAGSGTFIYGSLYGLDYTEAESLKKGIRAARKHSLGLMFFDVSYIIKNDWWRAIREEFQGPPVRAPHRYPGLLPSLRAVPSEVGEK